MRYCRSSLIPIASRRVLEQNETGRRYLLNGRINLTQKPTDDRVRGWRALICRRWLLDWLLGSWLLGSGSLGQALWDPVGIRVVRTLSTTSRARSARRAEAGRRSCESARARAALTVGWRNFRP